MKTLSAYSTVLAVALVSATVLFSASASAEVSRAQVQAELAQARASGELPNYGMDSAYVATQVQRTDKARAEAQADAKKAQGGSTQTALRAERPAKTQAPTQ